MASQPAKVVVALEVNVVVEVTDAGYLGVNETVSKHIQHATEEARNWQFLVKKGSLEPEPVRTKIKVLSIGIIPEVP